MYDFSSEILISKRLKSADDIVSSPCFHEKLKSNILVIYSAIRHSNQKVDATINGNKC